MLKIIILVFCFIAFTNQAYSQILKEDDPAIRICKLAVEYLVSNKDLIEANLEDTSMGRRVALDKLKNKSQSPVEIELVGISNDSITYVIKGSVSKDDKFTCRFSPDEKDYLVLHPFGIEQSVSVINDLSIKLAGIKKYKIEQSDDKLHMYYSSLINNLDLIIKAHERLRFIEAYLYTQGGYPIEASTSQIKAVWQDRPDMAVVNY